MKTADVVITVDLTSWNAALAKAIVAVNEMQGTMTGFLSAMKKFIEVAEKFDKELEAKRAYRARFGPDPRVVQRALETTGGWVNG